jgi:hypothetical protein
MAIWMINGKQVKGKPHKCKYWNTCVLKVNCISKTGVCLIETAPKEKKHETTKNDEG